MVWCISETKRGQRCHHAQALEPQSASFVPPQVVKDFSGAFGAFVAQITNNYLANITPFSQNVAIKMSVSSGFRPYRSVFEPLSRLATAINNHPESATMNIARVVESKSLWFETFLFNMHRNKSIYSWRSVGRQWAHLHHQCRHKRHPGTLRGVFFVDEIWIQTEIYWCTLRNDLGTWQLFHISLTRPKPHGFQRVPLFMHTKVWAGWI